MFRTHGFDACGSSLTLSHGPERCDRQCVEVPKSRSQLEPKRKTLVSRPAGHVRRTGAEEEREHASQQALESKHVFSWADHPSDALRGQHTLSSRQLHLCVCSSADHWNSNTSYSMQQCVCFRFRKSQTFNRYQTDGLPELPEKAAQQHVWPDNGPKLAKLGLFSVFSLLKNVKISQLSL